MKLPLLLRVVLRIAPRGQLREAMEGDLREEVALRVRQDGRSSARRWAWRQAVRAVGPCLRLRLAELDGRWTMGGGIGGGRKLRHAVRAIRGRPLHAALVVLTFALGIGLNTSILATASQLVLAPLPYPDADRLVVPWPGRAIPGRLLAGILEDSPTFDGLALYWDQAPAEYYDPAAPDARAIGYTVASVSRSYLELLGLEPVLGRGFRDSDVPAAELRSGVSKVVLTHQAWERRFGSDPGVLGVQVRNGPYTTEIIGVMPPEATPMAQGLDGWTVVGFESELTSIARASFQAIGRLESASLLDRARAELRTRLARVDSAGRDGAGVLPQWSVPARFGPVSTPVEERTLVPLRSYLSGNARGGLALLVAAGLATLLVALVNASALALSRSLERRQEAGLRLVLGARRRDLLGLIFAEQLLLAGAGGGLALALAWLGTDALAALLPGGLPHALVERVGSHAVGWTLAGSLLCSGVATAVASVPLLKEGVVRSVGSGLGAGGRTVTGARRGLNGLLTLQVALITVLMIGAGLLLRTVDRLRSVDAGFSWDRTAVIRLQASGLWQRDAETPRAEILERYFEQLIPELLALERVEAAGQGTPPLATPVNSLWEITDGARAPAPGRPDIESGWRMVGAGDYFGALAVPLLRGRNLGPEDAPDGLVPSTAVVNELFARRLWPDRDPVGRSFHLALGAMQPATLRVVGVVGTYRTVALDRAPVPLFFTRFPPQRSGTTPLLVRVQGPPAQLAGRLEEAVHAVNPRVPVLSVEPLSETVDASIRSRQSALSLLGGLAAIGLGLGLLGIYGVTSLNAARRTRELGIRIALGARGASVVGLVVGSGLRWVGLGLAAGVLTATQLVPFLREMLFETPAVDPGTFTVVPVFLLATAVVASLVPAVRAARLDPARTLREE